MRVFERPVFAFLISVGNIDRSGCEQWWCLELFQETTLLTLSFGDNYRPCWPPSNRQKSPPSLFYGSCTSRGPCREVLNISGLCFGTPFLLWSSSGALARLQPNDPRGTYYTCRIQTWQVPDTWSSLSVLSARTTLSRLSQPCMLTCFHLGGGRRSRGCKRPAKRVPSVLATGRSAIFNRSTTTC